MINILSPITLGPLEKADITLAVEPAASMATSCPLSRSFSTFVYCRRGRLLLGRTAMARFRNPLLTHGGLLGCLRVRLLRKRNRAPSGGRHSPASGVLTNSTCELRLLAGRVRLGTKRPP